MANTVGKPQEIFFDEFFENIKVLKIACTSSQGFALVESDVKTGTALYSWGYGFHNDVSTEPTTRKYPQEIALDVNIKVSEPNPIFFLTFCRIFSEV